MDANPFRDALNEHLAKQAALRLQETAAFGHDGHDPASARGIQEWHSRVNNHLDGIRHYAGRHHDNVSSKIATPKQIAHMKSAHDTLQELHKKLREYRD